MGVLRSSGFMRTTNGSPALGSGANDAGIYGNIYTALYGWVHDLNQFFR